MVKENFRKAFNEKKLNGKLPELEVLGDEISKSTKIDFFKPVWIPFERVNSLTIYPKRVVEKLQLI